MSLFAIVAVVVVSFGLPAWAMTDDVWLSIAAAPLLFGLCAAVTGAIAAILTVPLLPIFLTLAVAANLVALWSLFTRTDSGLGSHPVSGAALSVVAACGLIPLRAPLLDWDTRTHWLGPARWYYGGGHYVRYALTNPAFHHRSYPPLIPAAAGTAWLLQGHVDLRSGQIMISVMNFGG